MKKQVADYIKTLSGQSSYSGNIRTMFVKGLSNTQILLIGAEFPNLPFKIKHADYWMKGM